VGGPRGGTRPCPAAVDAGVLLVLCEVVGADPAVDAEAEAGGGTGTGALARIGVVVVGGLA
jgi:hypothetical protein